MFIILIFTILFVFFSTPTDVTTEEIRNNLSNINEVLFNITENIIPYTNLYEKEPTVKDVVFNIAHGIGYGVIVDVNTALPLAIETAGGRYAVMIIKFVILYIIIMLIFSLPRIITMIIVFVFFIKEKKKSKTKFWQ